VSESTDWREIVTEAGRAARRDLAWLAAVHVVLKSCQQDVPGKAAYLLTYPELALQVTNYSPQEARRIWVDGIGHFHAFRDWIRDPARDNPGAYLNKSAVVYAVAVLEEFLQTAVKAKEQLRHLSIRTLEALVERVQGKELRNGISAKRRKAKKRKVLVSDFENKARDVLFLSALRHVIVHKGGVVDQEFLAAVGYPSGDPKWDPRIWATPADFWRDYEEKKPATLAIEKVIIPYLRYAGDFVANATHALTQVSAAPKE
jgi:hypothetical protein